MSKSNQDLDRIRELIDLMRESGVTELRMDFPDFKVSLKRDAELSVEKPAPVAATPVAAAESAVVAAVEAAPTTVTVTATVVGVFRAGERGRRVAVGDSVATGQVVGVIEAMKIPNDVRAPVSGVVRELLATEGTPVQYGQALLVIEPLLTGEGVGDEAEAV